MGSVRDLAEVASRASAAQDLARSAAWQDRGAVERAAQAVAATLEAERAVPGGPGSSPTGPSPGWERRLRQLAEPVAPRDPLPGPDTAAAAAEADAQAAVAAARIALTEATLAVLHARLAADDAAGEAPGGPSPVRTHPVARQVRALAAGVRTELGHLVAGRPRTLTTRLLTAAATGALYLVFLRLFRWDVTERHLPYLALYALSLVLGSAVCTNAMCTDAARVRAALSRGTPLWQVIVAKNAAVAVLVGTVGLALSLALAWRTGDTTALVTACGLLATMILLWLGLANVLSVALPLRVEPLGQRRRDRSLRTLLLSLAVSYGFGHVVNLMLYWRIWAKRAAVEEFGGLWIPVVLTVASAAVTWLLLTVLAVTLADRPGSRRLLLSRMADLREPAPRTAVRSAST